MDTRIVTLKSTSTVSLVPETGAAPGQHAGSRPGITRRESPESIQPLLADNLDDLCGIFSSDTDLVAELQQERRQDKW
jgi:hypothetical protein